MLLLLLLFCFDHNKIAPCGMIQVFLIKLNSPSLLSPLSLGFSQPNSNSLHPPSPLHHHHQLQPPRPTLTMPTHFCYPHPQSLSLMPSESPLKQFWSLAEALPLPEVFHDALYLCHPAVSNALLEDGLGSLLVLPPDPTGRQSSKTMEVVHILTLSALLHMHYGYYLTLVMLLVTATLPRKGAECPQLLMSSVPYTCVAVCVTTQSLVLPPPTFLSYLHLYSPSHSLRSSSDTCMPKEQKASTAKLMAFTLSHTPVLTSGTIAPKTSILTLFPGITYHHGQLLLQTVVHLPQFQHNIIAPGNGSRSHLPSWTTAINSHVSLPSSVPALYNCTTERFQESPTLMDKCCRGL